MNTNDYLTTSEAGCAVGLDESQVRRLCRAGLVPHTLMGGMYLIPRAGLAALESRPRAGRPKKLSRKRVKRD